MNIEVKHKDGFESSPIDRLPEQEEENILRYTEDVNNKMPIGKILIGGIILAMLMYIAALASRDTSLQDANDTVIKNNTEAYNLCQRVEKIETETTQKYEYIETKWLTPEVKLKWSCVAKKRVLSWEIIPNK